MKPIEATVSARMPASAPKPTAFTNRIATMTGWNERQSTMRAARRPAHPRRHQVARGEQARTAARARCRAPTRARRSAGFRRGRRAAVRQRAKFGGNMRREEAAAVLETGCEALPREVELRAGVDDVEQRAATPADRGAASSARSRGAPVAADCVRCASFAASPRRRRSASDRVASARPAGRRRPRCAARMPTMRSAKRRASSTSCMLTMHRNAARARDAAPAAP